MWNRLLKAFIVRLIKSGTLTVYFPDGDKVVAGDHSAPNVVIHLKDPGLPAKLVLNPELAMGEAYMDNTLVIEGDDLRGFMTLIVRNFQNGHLPWWQALARKARIAKRRWDQYIPIARAKRNASHHYDIKSEFYELFLDGDMQYTCAYFRTPDDSLEQAQINKKRHIAQKLLIEPGMRVLDIGSGWGGLGISLAKEYGAQVVGVTLSEEQRTTALKRARDAGVEDQVDFRLQDYRDVSERFDRIVSVGMLEHVGQPQYAKYFRMVERNLSEDGVALIHFIGRTSPPGNLSPWFQKYIFPSGYTPALSEVLTEVEKTMLEPADLEVWRTHYDRTLLNWLERFEHRLDAVRHLGYDERFIRMWRYYLLASELSMSDMPHVLFQLQLHKKQTTVPVTREYLYCAGQSG